MGTDAVRRWLAEYLSWIVWVLLALWAPPAVFTGLVDLGVIRDAGSGFANLTDVPFLLTVLQLALMAASLPGLVDRREWGWRLQVAATAVWAGHMAWLMQSGVRLAGWHTLRSRETVFALVALSIYGLMLQSARRHFDTPRSVALP